MLRTRREVSVLVLVLLCIGTLLALAVQQARTAARLSSSQNNLKQLSLALQNHESTYKRLPKGCDEETKHGWMTFINPYIEQSWIYESLDLQLSWDNLLNLHEFTLVCPSYLSPRERSSFCDETWAMASYHANPALLYRGSKVTFAELGAGLTNTWLIGEVNGGQTPFAYPYNWRLLDRPINQGPGSFGGWRNGTPFVFADGNVKFISSDVDFSVLQQFADAAPLPEKSLYARPDRTFNLTETCKYSIKMHSESQRLRKDGPIRSYTVSSSNGSAEILDFQHGMFQFERLINENKQAQALRTRYPTSMDELALIVNLKNLQILCLFEPRSSDNGQDRTALPIEQMIEGLKSLHSLKMLRLKAAIAEQDREKLQIALPNCELVFGAR